MKLLVATLVFLFTSMSFAGREGGGGKGVVCRNTQDEVQSVELLDLWEARTIYQRPLVASTLPMYDQVRTAVHSLRNAISFPIDNGHELANRLNGTISIFESNSKSIRWLKGVRLSNTQDSFEAVTPKDCAVEQIVTYQDSIDAPLILINDDLYQKMDITNRAALITHEALYKYLRTSGSETNSVRVRRAVGIAFSGKELPTMKDLIPAKYFECSTSKVSAPLYHYFIFEGADKQFYATASFIGGQYKIGFETAAQTLISNPHELLGGPCTGEDFVSYGIAGAGSVDYDRTSFIRNACVGGQRIISASTMQDSEASSGVALQCFEH